MSEQNFRADLHCHSTCSDGTFTPKELIDLAKKLNLSALSITDHDTIEAYSSAVQLAKDAGIELLSGVEFSTTLGETSIHILAYGFPLDSPHIRELCLRHIDRRAHRNQKILQLLSKHKMPITQDDIAPEARGQPKTLGRPHIAEAMVKKGYVGSITEAFRKYLGEGCLCYSPGEPIDTEETLDIIHKAGGIAIIAHPHLIQDQQALNKLLKMPFDGIECYYARFPATHHQRWLKIAKKKGWLITGGSDFHGDIKPNLMLGSSWIDKTLFDALQTAIAKR